MQQGRAGRNRVYALKKAHLNRALGGIASPISVSIQTLSEMNTDEAIQRVSSGQFWDFS